MIICAYELVARYVLNRVMNQVVYRIRGSHSFNNSRIAKPESPDSRLQQAPDGVTDSVNIPAITRHLGCRFATCVHPLSGGYVNDASALATENKIRKIYLFLSDDHEYSLLWEPLHWEELC